MVINQNISISIVLRGKPKKDGKITIQLRFHLFKAYYFNLNRSVTKEDWNYSKGIVKSKVPGSGKINYYLRSRLNEAQDIIDQFNKQKIIITHDKFKRKFLQVGRKSFFQLCHEILHQEYSNQKIKEKTYNYYRDLILYFKDFVGRDIDFYEVTSELIDKYRQSISQKSSKDTSIQYCVPIKKCYLYLLKDAPEEYVDQHPFKNIIWKKDFGILPKESLNMEELSTLLITYKDFAENNIILANTQKSDYKHLKVYLFMVYTALRHCDSITLEKKHIIQMNKNGKTIMFIKKKSEKTKKLIRIPITPQILYFLDFQDGIKNYFLFEKSTHKQVNKVMNRFAKKLRINKNLTTGTARHTFGTIGLSSGMNISQVQEIMAHTTEFMTKNYAKYTDETLFNSIKNWGATNTQEKELKSHPSSKLFINFIEKIRNEKKLSIPEFCKQLSIQPINYINQINGFIPMTIDLFLIVLDKTELLPNKLIFQKNIFLYLEKESVSNS